MFDRQSVHVAILLWGCVFNLLGAFCAYVSVSFEPQKRRCLLAMQLLCAGLLFNDSLAWAFRGEPGDVAYWIIRISNFSVFFLSDALLGAFHRYVCCYLFDKTPTEKQPRQMILLVYIIAAFGCGMVIVSQFTDLYYWIDASNLYHRAVFHPISLVIPLCGLIADAVLIVRYRDRLGRQLFISFISYIVLPLFAGISLLFYYGISLENIAIAISMILIFVSSFAEQNRLAAVQASELTEKRIALMMSQIQPHFIYNALGSIYQLCLTQPEQAADLTLEFSNYLRGNLSDLQTAHPISFLKEIEQVKHYVHIEEVRFPDITVKFDLQTVDFMVPALSVQPLVENAIKYGLRGLDSGGTVTISSRETERAYVVQVQDDGIGFDPAASLSEERSHIGIANVRSRLAAMSGGTLQITSKPGCGTLASIEIPKEND